MKRPNPNLPLLILAACCTPAFAQVDRRPVRTPGPDAAGVQRASCVLQIDADANRGNRTFDVQTLNALLTSTTLVDPAAQKALGLGPADWPKAAQVELTPAGSYSVRLGVTILPDAKLPPAAAQAFLDALAAAAKSAVDQVGARNEKAAAARVAALEADVAAAQKRYDAASAAYSAAVPRNVPGYDPDARFGLRNAGLDRAAMELALAGLRARLRVLDEEVAKLREADKPRPSRPGDAVPITGGDGLAPATRPAADGLYERFEADRITTRCTIAETEAKLDLLNTRAGVATPPATAPTPADLDRLQTEQNAARQALSNAQNQLDQARRDRQNAGSPVRLLILDGRTGGE